MIENSLSISVYNYLQYQSKLVRVILVEETSIKVIVEETEQVLSIELEDENLLEVPLTPVNLLNLDFNQECVSCFRKGILELKQVNKTEYSVQLINESSLLKLCSSVHVLQNLHYLINNENLSFKDVRKVRL